MKKFQFKKVPFNNAGLFFSLTGFVLTLLCFVGCQYSSGRGLYFAKVTDAEIPSTGHPVSVYYGWQGYCIQDQELTCFSDRSIMLVPFDVSIANHLNSTYPRLFTNETQQDQDLNPGARPDPPHDPKIYPAAVLCLLCSATLSVFCVMRIAVPLRYQDEYYTRGFLACGSAVLALLLILLSSVMYQNAIYQLNLSFPNLVATQGPCMTMIGCSFASFAIAGCLLLRGAMNLDSDADGYSPI